MSVDKKKVTKGKSKKVTKPEITVKVDATFEQIVLSGVNYNPKKKAQ